VTGKLFTHDVARTALLDFDEVHFATHGKVENEAPLFSRLMTSPAAGQPGRFSLYELTDMEIRARLVILSACETGLGKWSGGDEIAGLNRAFLAAGAKVVVSSLWSVSDESTVLLMKEFHRGLHDGLAPAVALRDAELAVRKQYPQPYYWAPFILTGAY
jgi:CHAT domain-containing protein